MNNKTMKLATSPITFCSILILLFVNNLTTVESMSTTPLPADGSGVAALAWSPDGKQLAVGHGADTGRLEIIDPVMNSQLYTSNFPDSTISNIQWSPNGDRIVFRPVSESGYISILNTLSHAMYQFMPRSLTAYDPTPIVAATNDPLSVSYSSAGIPIWSPDGQKLIFAAISSDTDAYRTTWLLLGNPYTNQGLANHRIEIGGEPLDLSWNPQSTQIAESDDHGLTIIWNISDTNQITEARTISRYSNSDIQDLYKGASGPILVNSLWSPDGNYIASVDSAGYVDVFNPNSGAILGEFNTQLGTPNDSPGAPLYLTWSPDSKFFAGTDGGSQIVIYSAPSAQVVKVISTTSSTTTASNRITALSWSPDGTRIAYGTAGSSIVGTVSTTNNLPAEVPTSLPAPSIALINRTCEVAEGATWTLVNRTNTPITIHWIAETTDLQATLTPSSGDLTLAPVTILGVESPQTIDVVGDNPGIIYPSSTPTQGTLDLKVFVNGTLVLTSPTITCSPPVAIPIPTIGPSTDTPTSTNMTTVTQTASSTIAASNTTTFTFTPGNMPTNTQTPSPTNILTGTATSTYTLAPS